MACTFTERQTERLCGVLDIEADRCRLPRGLAGRTGPVARPLARHKQSTGLFVSGLGLLRHLRPACRPKSVDGARHDAKGDGLQTEAVLTLKTRWRDGTTHLVMSPLEFIQQLAALVPRPRLHLIRFHGGLAPSSTTSAKMRALVVPQAPDDRTEAARHVRGELCAPQVGAAELDPAAQARLGYDITCVQVSLLESSAFEIDHEHCPN